MKSLSWIFCCCLIFATVMIMGLSLHSCKSKKAVESSAQIESTTMAALKEEMDSFYFQRLLERYNKNWTLEVLQYHPIIDSTGKVTDTYLEKSVQMSHQHERVRDSSRFDAVFEVKEETTEVAVSEDSELKEVPEPKDYRIFIYLILVLLLIKWLKNGS